MLSYDWLLYSCTYQFTNKNYRIHKKVEVVNHEGELVTPLTEKQAFQDPDILWFLKKLNNNQEMSMPIEVGPHNICPSLLPTSDCCASPWPPSWMAGCAHGSPAGALPLCWGEEQIFVFLVHSPQGKGNHVQIWWSLNWMEWLILHLYCFPWREGRAWMFFTTGKNGATGYVS